MVNLESRRSLFIDGLVNNAGWTREMAEQHFSFFAPTFEIVNELDFVIAEAARLRARYPKVTVAPLFYNVDNNRLYLVRE
jgi:carbonic anhydrase